jgi:membrane protease YdiL (CAAX protease family)
VRAIAELFWNAGEQRLRALWRVLLHALATILIGVVFALVWRALDPVGFTRDSELLAMAYRAVVVLAATQLCVRVLDGRELRELGFELDRWWWLDLGVGFAIGAVLMSGIFSVERAAGWVEIEARYTGAQDTPFALALTGMLVSFAFVALSEELFSRGYQLTNLREGLRSSRLEPRLAGGLASAGAVLLTSVAFALLHIGNPGVTVSAIVGIAAAGVVLALGYLWTGQLALPIGLHLSWNFFQGNVFGFPVSGTDPGPRVLALRQAGDPLITGGDFGPEAGLIGLAALLVGALLQLGWAKLGPRPRAASPDAQPQAESASQAS